MSDKPLEWFDSIDFDDAATAIATVARAFEGWAPELLELIAESDVSPLFRPLFGLPIGHRWEHASGITLIGDAAHLAPPDGEGANWALFDAGELGRAIADNTHEIDAALRVYDEALFPRNQETSSAAASIYPEFQQSTAGV